MTDMHAGDPACADSRLNCRALAPSSNDASCARQVLDWLAHCEKTHIACNRPTTPLLPDRIIEIDDSANGTRLYLRSLPGQRARYCALSYRRSEPRQQFTTTHASIKRMGNGFSTSDLPKTFQDAVAVSVRLHIRYLWVDALCIIQDDVKDWAATMAVITDVYSNATITIAGSCSTTDCDGFLKARPVGDEPCLQVPFVAFPLMSQLGHLFIQRHHENTTQHRIHARRHQPLFPRAWALQERFTSRRVVFFDEFELSWECLESSYREGTKELQEVPESLEDVPVRNDHRHCTIARADGNAAGEAHGSRCVLGRDYGHSGLHFRYADSPDHPRKCIRRSGTRQICSALSHSEARNDWYQILSDYGSCELTYFTDALPALSGIAKTFERIMGDEYLAGIWMTDIHVGLLWSVETKNSNMSRSKPITAPIWNELNVLEQKTALSGPSWSWASRFGNPGSINFSVRSSEMPLPDPYSVRLVGAELIPLFDEPLGDRFVQLRNGSITLRGFTQEVVVQLSDDRTTWPPALKFELAKTRQVTMDGSLDDYYAVLSKFRKGTGVLSGELPTAREVWRKLCKRSDSVAAKEKVTYLGLLISNFDTFPLPRPAHRRFYGLLLSKIASREEYQRCGLFFVDGKSLRMDRDQSKDKGKDDGGRGQGSGADASEGDREDWSWPNGNSWEDWDKATVTIV